MNLWEEPYLWQSRMIGELQLVFTVKNKGVKNKDGYTKFPKYIGALVKLLQ